MYSYELCRQYLDAVTSKDLGAVLELFVPEATVQAPISGMLNVKDFHTRLFNSSSAAIARLKHVFEGLGEPEATALQFIYTWVFNDGTVIVMDGVTIFELSEVDKSKFKKLTIIYDPTNLKRHLNEAQINSLSLG